MTRLVDYLSSRSNWTLIRMGLAIVVAIGLADYLTGYELSLFIFYLVPVSLVTPFCPSCSGCPGKP
jgi:hypothetical protein